MTVRNKTEHLLDLIVFLKEQKNYLTRKEIRLECYGNKLNIGQINRLLYHLKDRNLLKIKSINNSKVIKEYKLNF